MTAKLTAEDVKQVTITFHAATGEKLTREVPRLAARSFIAGALKDGYWDYWAEEGKTACYQVVKVEVDAVI